MAFDGRPVRAGRPFLLLELLFAASRDRPLRRTDYAAWPCATASSSRRSSRRCCSPRARCPSGDAWTLRAQVGRLPRAAPLRRPLGLAAHAQRPRVLGGLPRAGGDRRRARQASGDARRRAGLPAQRRAAGLRPPSPPPHRLAASTGARRCSRSSTSFTWTATRREPLPYSERRALLEELALDGPAWRTPASVVVERSEDFVARVEELGLEGVVAKRLSSTYIPGRRCTAWVKRKLRREERLAVTGIRRTREGHVEAIFVARRSPRRIVHRRRCSRAWASPRARRAARSAASPSCRPAGAAASPGIRPRCR